MNMDAALYYVCVAPGDAVREDADLVALSGQLFGEVADVSSQTNTFCGGYSEATWRSLTYFPNSSQRSRNLPAARCQVNFFAHRGASSPALALKASS